jgi:hypothetical protein
VVDRTWCVEGHSIKRGVDQGGCEMAAVSVLLRTQQVALSSVSSLPLAVPSTCFESV